MCTPVLKMLGLKVVKTERGTDSPPSCHAPAGLRQESLLCHMALWLEVVTESSFYCLKSGLGRPLSCKVL